MLQLVATAYQVLYSVTYQVPFARPFIDKVTSFFASAVRQGAGCYAAPGIDKAPRPTQTLQLYSVESCPYSRKVREALSALDLDFEVFPVPRETFAGYGIAKESRFRPQLLEVGGKLQYPFLVDRDRNTLLYESDDIVEYLWATYGTGASRPRKPLCDRLTSWIATLLRPLPHMGWLRTPSKSPQEPLQLFGFEGSAHTRLVREALDTLELPYITYTMAHGSSKRKDFLKRTGGIQYPYMIDPNTGFGSFEAPLLLRYLYHHYQTGPTVSERFFSYATTNALPSHSVYRGVFDWLVCSAHESFYRFVARPVPKGTSIALLEGRPASSVPLLKAPVCTQCTEGTEHQHEMIDSLSSGGKQQPFTEADFLTPRQITNNSPPLLPSTDSAPEGTFYHDFRRFSPSKLPIPSAASQKSNTVQTRTLNVSVDPDASYSVPFPAPFTNTSSTSDPFLPNNSNNTDFFTPTPSPSSSAGFGSLSAGALARKQRKRLKKLTKSEAKRSATLFSFKSMGAGKRKSAGESAYGPLHSVTFADSPMHGVSPYQLNSKQEAEFQ